MQENFTQSCSIHEHNEQKITGLCINQECPYIPLACQTCNQQFHSEHINDVKTSNQIIQYLNGMGQQIANSLSPYEEIQTMIIAKYNQFKSDIAFQKILIQSHLKKEIEIYPNSKLKSLSKMIKTLKVNIAIQDNEVNKNIQQLELFYQFLQETVYVYPFSFKPIEDQQLSPEEAKLKYNFLQREQIAIYPDLDKIQKSRFKLILKVLELKKDFQLMLCGEQNNTIFKIDQDGILTDDLHKQVELGQKIIKGTIIILSFAFQGLKKIVKIEILYRNTQNIYHIIKIQEKYKQNLNLFCISDYGQLQILHDWTNISQKFKQQKIQDNLNTDRRNENFTQRCAIYGHNELQISALCINQDCIQYPQACQTCNQSFHSDHVKDVKTSHQIREYLQQMAQQITIILSQYEKIWVKILAKYEQFYSDIAYQKLLIQQHLKKEIEIYPGSKLQTLSELIKAIKINMALQDNVANQNLQQFKQFYQFFQVIEYVYSFTFKKIEGQKLNPENTKLKYNFLFPEPIDIYPNIDTIQEPRFKFILKVLEIRNKFQLMMYSGALNETIFSIDQDGVLTDNYRKQVELEQKIIQGTIIILLFTFEGLSKNVKIEIRQENNVKSRYTHRFLEKYKLRLVVFSDQGQLQILHDI